MGGTQSDRGGRQQCGRGELRLSVARSVEARVEEGHDGANNQIIYEDIRRGQRGTTTRKTINQQDSSYRQQKIFVRISKTNFPIDIS